MPVNKKIIALCVSAAIGVVLAAAVTLGGAATAASGSTAAAAPVTLPAAASMTALSTPATARDRALPKEVAEQISHLTASASAPDADQAPGQAVAASVRALVSASGHDVWAVQTDRGRVCGGLIGGSAGCFDGFRTSAPVVPTVEFRSGRPLVIYGFAPDDVVSVHVVSGGSELAAATEKNAFVWSGNVVPSDIQALQIVYRDGSKREMPLALRGG